MRKEGESKISFCHSRGLRASPQTYHERDDVIRVCEVFVDDWVNGGWLLFYWRLTVLWVIGVGFDNTCTISGKWNISRLFQEFIDGYIAKILRLSALVVEYSVKVMTAGSQSRQCQIESYG